MVWHAISKAVLFDLCLVPRFPPTSSQEPSLKSILA